MKPTFYPRLAWMGIKKNARLYVPYLLSCAFMAAMLYVIAYLAVTPALYTVNGKVNGSGTSAVAMTMSLGSFVVSVFIALFLFYTNSFLLRRRKKEFGLYSVLGMDRGALSAILFWETLLAAAFTLIAGLGLGLLLSYVSQSALLRLLSLPAAAFTVSLAAIKQCAITFIAIFALLYVRGVLSLRHAQGAALLKSENVGEKPPKSQWLLVIPGLALLLGAYYIAATINDPVQAMLLFFLAVIMVILSTYLLFISGSVTLCKTLQKDEKFYYKKRNFVSLSSLTYRMKRNGAGLASICILSTMVLVMLASTASLYFGAEDAINTLAVQNHWHPTEMAGVRAEFFSLYGSLFFLGILLSVLFLFATLLMLYYKQVVEGYEDASRFAIMQRVGMTKRDIRESVNAQMLLIFLLLMPLAQYIPMACLAGVLVIVSYNMSGWRTFRELLRNPKSDVAVLLITFFLTVIFDLTVAIEFGLVLACLLFIKRVMETTEVNLFKDEIIPTDADGTVISEEHLHIPDHTEVYEINGPYFFGIANRFEEVVLQTKEQPKVRIIRMRKVPFIDSTGIHNLTNLCEMSHREGVHIILSGVNPKVHEALKKSGFYELLGKKNICDNIHTALEVARHYLNR